MGLFQLAGIFFLRPLPLQDFFWVGSGPLHEFFFFRGGRGGLGLIFYCCSLNLHSPQSDCLEQASNKYFFLFHSRFALLSKLYSGGDNQVSDTFISGYCQEPITIAQLMGLRCIFCLMSKEITILFIPSPVNKIHFWHAVNQGF